MKRLRLLLGLLALLAGGACLLESHLLKAEAEAFVNTRPLEMNPGAFPAHYPRVMRHLKREGLYPWPDDLGPVEAKNRMGQAHRDLLCRIPAQPEEPPC